MLPILLLLVPPFYTTVRVNDAQILPVGVGVMLPIFCSWLCLFQYGEGKCSSNFRRSCRRCAAYFSAVGCAFYTTARVNAARFLAVGVAQLVFSADADVYAAERRGLGPFVSLLSAEKATTRSRNTAAILPARPGP